MMTDTAKPVSDQAASSHVRRLIDLTETLTQRLEDENRAFAARRPQDIVSGLGQTQDMANAYRRESTLLKATPALAAGAPVADRIALIHATERFERVLAAHARSVEAARVISEGVVKAVAAEVAASRAQAAGYGASGRAAAGDTTSVAYNRSA